MTGETDHQARLHKSLFRVVRRVVAQHGLSVLREGYVRCQGGPDFGVVRTEDVRRRKSKLRQVKILIEIKTAEMDDGITRTRKPPTGPSASPRQRCRAPDHSTQRKGKANPSC